MSRTLLSVSAFAAILSLAVLGLGPACAARAPGPPEGLTHWPPTRKDEPPALKLYLIRTGSVVANWRTLVSGAEGREVEVPVCVFLVDHPDQGLILVDTGFSRRTALDPTDYPGRVSSWLLPVRMKEGEAAAEQIGRIGRRPDEVHTVILTHLHQDHTGGIEDFPDATYVLDRVEWEEGKTRTSLSGYVQRSYAGIQRMRLVDFPSARPLGTFPSGVDLFGDGTIWLVPTPGHTAGHTSVIVCLRSGPVFLTGDAAYLLSHVTGEATKGWEARWFIDFDGDQVADSIARIRRFRELVPGLLVIPGHDPETWDRLKHIPEFYE